MIQMKELEYPFDSSYIMKKSKGLKKALLADGSDRIHIKVIVMEGIVLFWIQHLK